MALPRSTVIPLILAGVVVGYFVGAWNQSPPDGTPDSPPARTGISQPSGAPILQGSSDGNRLGKALQRIGSLEATVDDLRQENRRLATAVPPEAREPTLEELKDTKTIEEAVALVARDYELSLDERELPASALEGIYRQQRAAVPTQIEVPPDARELIYRLIALRTSLDVVSSLRIIELARDPATEEKAAALGNVVGRARYPPIKRAEALIYHFGRQQGLTDPQIAELIDRAAKSPR